MPLFPLPPPSASQRDSRAKEQELEALRTAVQGLRQQVSRERNELAAQLRDSNKRAQQLSAQLEEANADRDEKAKELRSMQSRVQSLESTLKHQVLFPPSPTLFLFPPPFFF